jgi:hypothetical protein
MQNAERFLTFFAPILPLADGFTALSWKRRLTAKIDHPCAAACIGF